MRLKEILGDAVIVTIICGVAFGLYHYYLSTADSSKSARYEEPHEGIGEENSSRLTTEDCERLIDPNMKQNCRDSRLKRIAAEN